MPTRDFYSYRRRLPHWRLTGATYFITWRLASGQPELSADERTLVAEALRHFDGVRYELLAYVVMDDHVHAVVAPHAVQRLEQVVHSWKSYTTRLLQGERRLVVWQSEYFDRIIRDETELREKIEYVINNPRKRWPNWDDYPWVGFRGEAET